MNRLDPSCDKVDSDTIVSFYFLEIRSLYFFLLLLNYVLLLTLKKYLNLKTVMYEHYF